mmetsp:Transcript_23375/g.55613  ORF Transcript_23375/g.55613 Transcript_23375/m.55613 type:complete len:1197 (-) Transcript_23375:168-3758(-)
MNSGSDRPMRRSVSRIDGQVPSPTPMVGTSVDSTRVMRRLSPCSAASRPATSQPAEPPPSTTTSRIRSSTRAPGTKTAACAASPIGEPGGARTAGAAEPELYATGPAGLGRPAGFRGLELVPSPDHDAAAELGHRADLVLVAQVGARVLVGQVDGLELQAQTLVEVVAQAQVELAVGLDIQRLCAIRAAEVGRQELAAPVVGQARGVGVVLVEAHQVARVAQAHQHIRLRADLVVVVAEVGAHLGEVGRHAEAGVAEDVLRVQLDAVEAALALIVLEGAHLEHQQRVGRLAGDDLAGRVHAGRAGEVGEDVVADATRFIRLAPTGLDRLLVVGAADRGGQARDGLGRDDRFVVVLDRLREVAGRDVAALGVVMLGREVEVGRLQRLQVGVADVAAAAVDARQAVERAPALDGVPARPADGLAEADAQLGVGRQVGAPVDGGQGIAIAAVTRGVGGAAEGDGDFVGRDPADGGGHGFDAGRVHLGALVAQAGGQVHRHAPVPAEVVLAEQGLRLFRRVEVVLEVERGLQQRVGTERLDGRRAQVLEVEIEELVEQPRVIGARDAAEVLADGLGAPDVLGHRGGAAGLVGAPGVALDVGKGRPVLHFGQRQAEVQAAVAVDLPVALGLQLVDLVALVAVAEHRTLQFLQRRVQGAALDHQHRELVAEVHRGVAAVQRRGAQGHGRAQRVVGARGGGGVVGVEVEAQRVGRLPLQVQADLLVLVLGLDAGRAHRHVRVRHRLAVDDGRGRRAGLVFAELAGVVEPGRDVVAALAELLLGHHEVQRAHQVLGRLELHHELAVQALAVHAGERVVQVLRHAVDGVLAGAVLDRVRRSRWQATPGGIAAGPVLVVDVAGEALPAAADIGLGIARVAHLVGAHQRDAEAAVAVLRAVDAAEFGGDPLALLLAGQAAGRVVADQLDADLGDGFLDVEWALGADVDRGAHAAGRAAGTAGLVDLQRGDTVGGEVGEVERARAGRAAIDAGAGHLAAIEQHQVEVRAHAAHRDAGALAVGAVDGHAGDAAQRLGQVGVRELADVLSDDAVHQARRRALQVDRGFQRPPDAGHDDRLQLRRAGQRLRRRSGGRGALVGQLRLGGGAGEQQAAGRGQVGKAKGRTGLSHSHVSWVVILSWMSWQKLKALSRIRDWKRFQPRQHPWFGALGQRRPRVCARLMASLCVAAPAFAGRGCARRAGRATVAVC